MIFEKMIKVHNAKLKTKLFYKEGEKKIMVIKWNKLYTTLWILECK